MNLKVVIPSVVLAGVFAPSFAVTNVYECIDAAGKITFSDHCPPGSRKKATRYSTEPADQMADVETVQPVVLYSVTRCDACDLVRNFLKKRNIPFTEKNVTEDKASEAEIRDQSGTVTVPVTMIGKKRLRGYDSYALEEAVAAAGFAGAGAPAKTGADAAMVNGADQD